MMNTRLSREQGLFIAALGLALFVRLAGLGVSPLSDYEARWALGALHIAGNHSSGFIDSSIGHNPLYTFLTAALFSVFKASDFTARFWPALAGASLVLVPYFFRRWLGSWPALLLAFGIAIDPGLTAAARLAGGPMLALVFGAWTIAAFLNGRRVWAALCLGLSLLTGTAVLHGTLIIGLVFLTLRTLSMQDQDDLEESHADSEEEQAGSPASRALDWMVLVGTVLLVGTAFARYPAGLSAFAGAIPAYLSGWVQPSGVPASQMFAGLVFQQPLAVVFALVGLVLGVGERTSRWAAIWAGIALLIVLLYPARQVLDLIWVLVPLWVLAARGMQKLLLTDLQMDWVAWAQSALIFILVIMFGLNMASLSRVPQGQGQLVGGLVLLGLIVLGVLTAILIGLGWSRQAARQGTGLGLIAGLGLSVLASLFSVTAPAPIGGINFWSIAPSAGEVRLFGDTLRELSEWGTGRENSIDIAVAVDSAALRWEMRDYPEARFLTLAQVRGLSEPPAIVITGYSDTDPTLTSTYRGQDFIWWVFPAWSPGLANNFRAWMGLSNFPVNEEKVILWAQTDLFPGDIVAVEAADEPSIEFDNQPGD